MENRWSDRRELRLDVDVFRNGEKLCSCQSRDVGLGGAFLDLEPALMALQNSSAKNGSAYDKSTLPDITPGKPAADGQEISEGEQPLEESFLPEAPTEPAFGPVTEGPISEEKTFDETVAAAEAGSEEVPRRKRKTASPFVVVGGALIIILGLLYGALTFLKG